MTKALQEPLDNSIDFTSEIPYTLSYVIRKRIQIDNFSEMPKDKRPPELMIWDGYPEEIDDWIDRVYKLKKPEKNEISLYDSEIED